jgi:transcriptional regulator with XRE-family HTH domain
MVAYETFARNLRLECAQYGTIAKFCRASGINRQQFNKYLAGSALPNAATLRKICKVLDTSEERLFREAAESTRAGAATQASAAQTLFTQFGFGRISGSLDFRPKHLGPGWYFCYFAAPEMPHVLVKSLLTIAAKGDHFEFARSTIIRSIGDKKKPLAKGRHTGIVFANEDETYLLGLNRYPPYQLSLMTLENPDGLQANFLKGSILTKSAKSLICAKAYVVPILEKGDLRQLIRGLGVMPESDLDFESKFMSGLIA